MRVDFPYDGYKGIAPAEVSDRQLMGVFEPRRFSEVNEDAVIRRGLAEPYGAPPLRQAVNPGDRVLIVVDDGTRGTPVARLLEHVIPELYAAGVRDENITFLAGLGTHRAMTDEEIRNKLGQFYGRYVFHQHHYQRRGELRHFGTTRDGTKVTANRLIWDHDFVLGIGSIVPHRVKGMSGGAKIIFPGASGPEMMDRNQWQASMSMSETVMGVAENPMRRRMEEAARIVGLNYIINTVSDIDGRVVGCFCGDFVKAHRAGSRRAAEVFAVHVPDRADIVIIDAHPADRDFWQSAKGLYCGTMAVKRGGTLILVAPNPEGVADNHPILLELGYRPHGEVIDLARDNDIDDVVGLSILADVAQIVDQADCIIVSPGVSPQDAKRLGLRHAASVQQALTMALARHGSDTSVAVIRHGGHALPVVATEDFRGTGTAAFEPAIQAGQREAVGAGSVLRMGLGALAGLVGTMALQAVRYPSERYAPQTMPPMAEDPGRFMVEQAERTLPRRVVASMPQKAEEAAANALAMGYGTAFGAVYGTLDRDDQSLLLDGALLGLATWAAGYLGWLPATGLMKPIWKQQPLEAIAPPLRHVMYGLSTVASYHIMRRLLETSPQPDAGTCPSRFAPEPHRHATQRWEGAVLTGQVSGHGYE